MTIPEFIALWQAHPFRAFRLHTARGVFRVDYPLAVALSPLLQILVVVDDARVERISWDEVERAEVFGEAVSLAEVIDSIAPEKLGRNAQLLAEAQASESTEPNPLKVMDAGKLSFLGSTDKNGIYHVEAALHASDGSRIFGTSGMRWNLHGVEQFENGTSFYLHHPDHPLVEQRVIVWPPNSGTLVSFAEARPLAELMEDLRQQDERLAAEPAKVEELTAAYYRKIVREYPAAKTEGQIEAFGAGPDDDDFDRFEMHLVAHKLPSGRTVNNPSLIDVPAGDYLFNLTETAWDATFKRGQKTIDLELCYGGQNACSLKATIDPYARSVRWDDNPVHLPLAFFEQELSNYALYEVWDLLCSSLLTGPARYRQPTVVMPLSQGFVAELWVGESGFPLPFLQPRILNPEGETLLDLRATVWAAVVKTDATKPVVTLRLISSEKKQRYAPDDLELRLDLVTRRVTCTGCKGSTTIGMIQAMLRKVRSTKWLAENLPTWFAKGALLLQP